MSYVYDFGSADSDAKELLGGKGAGLAEMTDLGLPVPPGFTITTEACRVMLHDGELPDELWMEVDEAVARLEKAAGRTFGAGPTPLLVSVRSGAVVSMPGMMDTVLNLGLNDEVVEVLTKILRAVVEHRVGRVEVGQPSVVVAVSSAHRIDAFEAARFLIDELKANAPLWKKEHWPGGSEWVEGA